MRQKQSHSESLGKDGVNVERPLTKAEAKKAMARFESLTRQLLTVPRGRLQEEQERYEKRRKSRQYGKGDLV
jgi:hypothetical protein